MKTTAQNGDLSPMELQESQRSMKSSVIENIKISEHNTSESKSQTTNCRSSTVHPTDPPKADPKEIQDRDDHESGPQ